MSNHGNPSYLPDSVPSDPKPAKAPSTRLIVLIPDIDSHSSTWKSLREQIEKEEGYKPDQVVWFPFDYGNQVLKSLALLKPERMGDLARGLRARVDGKWAENKGFKDVVVIGHGLGGLIARQVYLLAAGAVPNQEASLWGNKVSQIVLFASPNRGMKRDWKWWIKPLSFLLHISPLQPQLLYEDALQGSNFLTNLRVDWIHHFRGNSYNLQDGTGLDDIQFPRIVQFHGINDQIVDQDSNKDISTLPNSYYQEIPDAGHSDLYRLDLTQDPGIRYALLRKAFIESPSGLLRSAPASTSSQVKRVVFLLHGIRASNVDNWVTHLAEKIALSDPDTLCVPLGYGYFHALQFASRGRRKKNIRIFQDAYTEYLAQYPAAQFNIIAHSNGTYMLGYSLEKIRGMRFANVALAGSALPESHPWSNWMQDNELTPRQVSRVMNERANQDWPIALLCKALVALGQNDVGTSGFDGFYGGSVSEVAYHNGDHGAALREKNYPHLVKFILDGEKISTGDELVEVGYYRQLSNLTPYITWGALIALLGLLLLGWKLIGLMATIIIALVLFLVLGILLEVV